MIIVIDTNVWVSALQFGRGVSTPARAIEHAMRRDKLATCAEIDNEIMRILTEKFLWKAGQAREIIDGYFKKAVRVQITGAVHVCRDPNDDMILECAALAGAQIVVAGDKDLLSLRSYKGIRIVTPAEYIALNG